MSCFCLSSLVVVLRETQECHNLHHREFMVVLYVMSNGSAEENLRQIFRIFDINSDGTISQKELQKIVKDLFHLLKKDGDPKKESEVSGYSFSRK